MTENMKHVMTKEGLDRLEAELSELKLVKRKEITEKIKIARDFGDLSENAEYTEAKNEQGVVESRILELETILRNTSVVDEEDIPKGMVSVGSRVKVKDYFEDETVEYQIVGTAEADPMNNKISNLSPVGSALMGKKRNQVVEVQTPLGLMKFKILSISK
ncbi:Transcription elongation factor GreA [Clostridiaceae bacterium JG1575]|nr:Transcription elongation factor GreA [Clostridiaceae bacterium JG1575]